MGKVRVTLDLDEETYKLIYEKFGNVQQTLQKAALQLASSSSGGSTWEIMAEIDRLMELNEKIFQIERQCFRIASAIAERKRLMDSRIPEPFRRVVDDTLAMRIQILYDMIKKLRKINVPLNYKKILKELQDDTYMFLREWRKRRRRDEIEDSYEAREESGAPTYY